VTFCPLQVWQWLRLRRMKEKTKKKETKCFVWTSHFWEYMFTTVVYLRTGNMLLDDYCISSMAKGCHLSSCAALFWTYVSIMVMARWMVETETRGTVPYLYIHGLLSFCYICFQNCTHLLCVIYQSFISH